MNETTMTEGAREAAIENYLDEKHGPYHRVRKDLIKPSDSVQLIAEYGPEMRSTILRVCGNAALAGVS